MDYFCGTLGSNYTQRALKTLYQKQTYFIYRLTRPFPRALRSLRPSLVQTRCFRISSGSNPAASSATSCDPKTLRQARFGGVIEIVHRAFVSISVVRSVFGARRAILGPYSASLSWTLIFPFTYLRALLTTEK